MSQRINQPSQSVRLTNVAVVKMNKNGKRFEIACYRNKVMNYRQGLETDLSEVLQTDRIFSNVSKGQFAKRQDLQMAFGTINQEEIAIHILQKGTLQISDLERQEYQDSTKREIANWIAANCVNPKSKRPYTTSQIQNAMLQLPDFKIHPTKSTKAQCLECVKQLQHAKVLPIERAKMELVIDCSQFDNNQEALQAILQEPHVEVTSPPDCVCITFLVDPSLYRTMASIAKECNARLEIKTQVVTQQGDANLNVEMERKKQTTSTTAMLEQLHIHTEEQGVLHVSEQEDEEEDTSYPVGNARKNQKKQQKQKSKKAKRREKEMQRQQALQQERDESKQQEQDSSLQQVKPNSTTDTKSCNTCGGNFQSTPLYRAHFRSDWHRYNVKLKMKGIAPISLQEFETCDANAFFETDETL